MIVLKDRHHSRQQTQLNAFVLFIAHCRLSVFRFMVSLVLVDGVVSVTWSGGGGEGGAGKYFQTLLGGDLC